MRHADQWDSIAELLATTPVPAGREAVWAQALAFLGAGHHNNAHLVASVLVVDSGGLVLLGRHRRYQKWGPLGGHFDSGDTSLCVTAARELLEETALAAHVHPAPIHARLSSYRCRTAAELVPHFDVLFAASAAASAPPLVANDEMTGLEWFSTLDLPAHLTPEAVGLIGLATAVATQHNKQT